VSASVDSSHRRDLEAAHQGQHPAQPVVEGVPDRGPGAGRLLVEPQDVLGAADESRPTCLDDGGDAVEAGRRLGEVGSRTGVDALEVSAHVVALRLDRFHPAAGVGQHHRQVRRRQAVNQPLQHRGGCGEQ
jgi:hypothetical protein